MVSLQPSPSYRHDDEESIATIHRALEANAGAADVFLSSAELKRIDEVAPHGVASGDRYNATMMALVGR